MAGLPAVKVNDPQRIFLRRGLRVGLMVPAVYALLLYGVDIPDAALPAAFAVYGTLSLADFGGPLLDRFRAALVLAVAGTVLYAVGALAGASGVVAVLATVVVVFAITLVSVLRGYFGAATTAVLLPWVIAATTLIPLHQIPVKSLGWLFGALVAEIAVVVLWPTHPRSALRDALADVADTAADLVIDLAHDPHSEHAQRRWTDLFEQVQKLHKAYDGRILRPGVGTQRDRSLLLAFDQVHRLRTELHAWLEAPDLRGTATEHRPPAPADLLLADQIAATLRRSAACLRAGRGNTGSAQLELARTAHEEQLVAWSVRHTSTDDPRRFRSDAQAVFHLRITSMAAQVFSVYVQGALNTRNGEVGRRVRPTQVTFVGETLVDPSAGTPVRELFSAQWDWNSPWVRTALRTSIALAMTVLVVHLTGAEYGFWVSMGALVALKGDATGTRRTIVSVFLGTIVGFVLASGVVWLAGDMVWVYWVLLPLMAFLTAFTPGAVSLGVGQASFTVFILVLFGIVHPDTYATGVTRVVDVLMGLAVSLLVSALLWPRGVAPMVRRALHLDAVATGNFFVAAYARLVEGPALHTRLDQARTASGHALTVAGETYDLALTQASAKDAVQVPMWTTVLNCTTQITFAAGVVSVLDHISPVPPTAAAGDAMLALAHHVSADLARYTEPDPRVARLVDEGQGRSQEASLARLDGLLEDDLREVWADTSRPAQDRAAQSLVLVFASAWLAQAFWLTQRMERRYRKSQPV